MKVLAVASAGGHWVQLLRLEPAFENNDIIYVCTNSDFHVMVPGHRFYSIPDSNRWNKFQLVVSFFKVLEIIAHVKPDIIITTGAAPGLVAIIAGKIKNKRTVWIDSIANADKLSLSGKLAVKLANRVYTQWPHLATDKIIFAGNVLK